MGISSNFRYDSFDRFPTEQRTKKIWDPVTTLDIINPSRGCLTCVGYAPSCRRRCRNPIKQVNRASAFQLLEDLSYIDTSTTDINAKLHELAEFTLCLRYHQSQRNDMVEKWSRKISQLRTASRNSSDANIDADRIAERTWQSKDMQELLARLGYKNKGADEFISSSPASQRCRKQYDQRSAQEEGARKRQEEEARKSREREQERQQQECEKREREERERKKREGERERKKREEERERKKREEERERKKREEERERKKREERERKKREEEKRCEEEQQARDREARERAERNERIRQKAQQAREERERKAREQTAKEREEWDKVWIHYGLRWDDIKKKDVKSTSEKLREIIPWPVKSGNWRDVSQSAVEEFFQKAPPETTGAGTMLQLMKMECLKWHADRIPRRFGVIKDKTLTSLFNTVAQVAIDMRAKAGRQQER